MIKKGVNGLKRELGLFQVTAAGVGVIVGAGIYALIGIAAGDAGNATWLAFLISAIVAICTGLSYAELSSMFRGDAGEYDYVHNAFNKPIALLIGCTMIFATIFAAATVSLAFADYFRALIPFSAVAVAITLLLIAGFINLRGIKETTHWGIFGTAVSIVGLLIIIFIGVPYYGSVNYLEAPGGIAGILQASALVFFAFIGFESIIKFRSETKHPDKTIPKAIILSILFSSLLYVLVAVSAVSVVGWERLSESHIPLALVTQQALTSGTAGLLMTCIALFSTSSTVILAMVAGTRQMYGMAHRNALPRALGLVHKTHQTPYIAIAVFLILAILFSIIGNLSIVANITNIFVFTTFSLVNLSLMILRYKCADHPRSFTCPANLGKLSFVALIGFLSSIVLLAFVIWNLVGA